MKRAGQSSEDTCNAFANAITNQTMLQGLTMFVRALSEPQQFFPPLGAELYGLAHSFSGLSRQTAAALDTNSAG